MNATQHRVTEILSKGHVRRLVGRSLEGELQVQPSAGAYENAPGRYPQCPLWRCRYKSTRAFGCGNAASAAREQALQRDGQMGASRCFYIAVSMANKIRPVQIIINADAQVGLG